MPTRTTETTQTTQTSPHLTTVATPRTDCPTRLRPSPGPQATPISTQPAGMTASATAPTPPLARRGTGALLEAGPFDVVVDRRGTACLKWDFAEDRGRPGSALPLWVADMDHATAPCVTSALTWRVRHGVFGYTEPDDAYHAALTSWFSRRYGWRIDPAWNTVTPGVVPALAVAVRALTSPGETVIIEEPVYYPFREVVEDNDRTVVSVPLVRDAAGTYRRDLAALESTIEATGARLLLLCNPHNPVGRVWTRAELEALAEVTLRHGVTVVADEIHADLTVHGHRTTPFASLGTEVAAATVTATSASKAFNIAGLQVANILIASPVLRSSFRRALAATGYSQPNALGLTATRAAYEGGQAWLEELLTHLEANQDHVAARLAGLDGVDLVPAEGTYLLWLDFAGLLARTGLGTDELDTFLLEEAGLWLDDGRLFGPCGAGLARLNIACPRALLDHALDRLEAAVCARLSRAALPERDQVALGA